MHFSEMDKLTYSSYKAVLQQIDFNGYLYKKKKKKKLVEEREKKYLE